MTRKAVREQFRLVSEAVFDGWTSRFRPSKVVGVGFVPSPVDSVVKFFLGSAVRAEFARHREGYERGLKAALDYGEEVALGTGRFEKYEDEILATDYWYANCDEEQDGLGEALVGRYRRIGEDVAPLVESGEDGFWEAAEDVWSHDEAVNALGHLFGYGSLVAEHSGAVVLESPPVLSARFDYTDEALRSLRAAEDDALGRVEAKADEVY